MLRFCSDTKDNKKQEMKQMSLQAVEYGCQYLESGLSVSSDSLAFHVFCFVQSNILSCIKPAAPKSTLPPRQELAQNFFSWIGAKILEILG